MLRPPSPVAPFTSLLDSHRHIHDENQSEWKTIIWDNHDLKQDEEYWIEDDNDELITMTHLHLRINIM